VAAPEDGVKRPEKLTEEGIFLPLEIYSGVVVDG
jgi:hypothetical protein